MQKTVTLLLALAVIAVAMPAQAQEAQDTEASQAPTHLTVLSFIVPYTKLPQWNAMTDSVTAPVLNGLVDEGHFLSWGQISHNWGDEWNAGLYIVSESHAKFLEGWAMYWERLNKSHPGWFQETAALFTEHKDNMYTIRRSYDGSR